jgi:site-specific DNA-cytosine methylase
MLVDILEPTVPDSLLLSNSYPLMMKTDPTMSRLSVLAREYRAEHKRGLSKPVLVSEVSGDTPSGRSRQTDRLYSVFSKSPTLLANRACDLKVDMGTADQSKWRTLTAVEAERLQTVPDGYTSCVKDPQRFKALGNGWTVDVITHIFKGIN